MTTDVLCIGETMAMVAPSPPRPLVSARDFVVTHGGAESNVAAWLAALGTAVHWCGRIGADPLGQRILAELRTCGIGLDAAIVDDSAPTAVYFKDPSPRGTTVWYYRTGSAGARLTPDDVDAALELRPTIVHLSGITPALSPSCAAAVEHAIRRGREIGALVSFDVNYRPSLWSPAAAADELARLAASADIVFVGRDEAATLWHTSTVAAIRDQLPAVETLVVKDASRGATAFGTDARVDVPALAVDVAEPVGAGDAFAAGFLRGRLLGLPSVQCLRLAHLVAVRALGSPTDLAALPDGIEELAVSGAPWPVQAGEAS